MSSGPASRLIGMETERVTASTTIEAAPEAVFAVLADPSAHADIDGTGWVREPLDRDRITAADRPFSAPGVPFTRNAFRNESLKFLNLRVQWKLDLKSDRKLIFFADVFNVFNWDNIELNGTTVTNYCAAPVPGTAGSGLRPTRTSCP